MAGNGDALETNKGAEEVHFTNSQRIYRRTGKEDVVSRTEDTAEAKNQVVKLKETR